MRKKIRSSTKSFLAVFLCVSMIVSLFIGDSALAFITDFGSTHIFYNEEREIGKGVVLNNWQGRNPDGTPKLGHTITFNPNSSDAMLVVSSGSNTSSRKTLSALAASMEKQGVKVIGGINGDFYNLTTAVPIGVVVTDGRLISSNNPGWNGIGFKEDGSVVLGAPDFNIKGIYNESEFQISRFNKVQSEIGPFLYSKDYGANTGTTVPSLEIVLDITMGELAIGSMVVATVSDIRMNATATPIGDNQLVLSVRNDKPGYALMSQFKIGDGIQIQFNDPSGKWIGVKQVVGGDKILIRDGAIVSGLATKDFNPFSAIGVKSNGDVVLYQVDGRTDASQGVSSSEAAQFLRNLGCVQAIKLDGGGSSAILARMPGYDSSSLINNPSDGRERANANGILLVSKQSVAIKNGTAQVNPEAQKLHLYPAKAYALPNSILQYTVRATDEYFFPTALPQNITWGSAAGTMDNNGKLTINTSPGEYQVMVGSGTVYGSAQLTVLSSVTSLRPSNSVVTLSPGSSIDLSCSAYYQDIKVASSDNAFNWRVEGNMGTITQDGVFTLAQGAKGKGRIIVSYGNVSASIDIVAGDSPNDIEDFENGTAWGSSIVRANSGSAAVVKDASLARSGSGLLKVNYDFTLEAGVEKGVAGVYAFRLDPNTKQQTGIVLANNPSAIGMWIYGDNSKTWIRGKVKDGNGQSFDIDFTPDYRTDTKTGGVDWTGWKYVEATIPSSRKGPFTLETPIRIMCSRDEMRNKGILYFDQIRAVYGVSNIDTQAPVVNVASPLNGSVIKTGKVSLQAVISDNLSGVDVKSIQVLLDYAAVGFDVTTNGAVTLKGELGTTLPLADGYHNLTFNYSDVSGNKGTTTVTFMVDTGAPQLIASTGSTFMEGGNFTTTISIKNPKNLRKIYTVFNYNPAQVDVVDADAKAAGKQVALEAWAKKGKVISHVVDEKNGRIVLEIDNLTNLSSSELTKLATITFKPKSTTDTTQVKLALGAMIVGKNPASQRFTVPDMNASLGYELTLKATGTAEGETTIFTVTDKNGAPVEGAGLYLDNGQNALWSTDKGGKIETTILTRLPVGTAVTVRAKKDGLISNKLTFTIGNKSISQGAGQSANQGTGQNTNQSTGQGSSQSASLAPQNLALSLMPEPGAIALNYVTPMDQTGTVVQYEEERTFTGSFSLSGNVKGSDRESALVNIDKTEYVRMHSATLANLKPGTTYFYRVGDTAGKFSPVYKFKTPDYDNAYSFAFVTDPQAANAASYQVFGDVLNRAAEKAVNPAFVLFGGDLADRGGNRGQWDMMFKAGADVFSSLPVMAVPGNHEYYDDADLTHFKSFFTLPENGPEGYKETAYSFQTKDALFLTLDTQKNISKQLQWLEETCKASNKKWKIVMMHRGIYSGFYDEAELRKVIAPVFDRVGIDLVLNGHDHTYLRTTMKDGKKVAPGAGTTYITGGSSAKKYYDAEKRAWTEVLYDTNNPVFTTFKVFGDKISVVSYHIENGITVEHDSFDILKK